MNIKDLRDSLLNSFNELQNGELDHKQAKEQTNMAGKIISSAKIELDYNKFQGDNKKIDFLEVDDDDGGEKD